MTPFWQFFLARLMAVTHPVFRHRELERFAATDWQPLIQSKVLVRAAEPETIIHRNGRDLAIRKHGERIFGVDDSDELPAITPLEAEDLIEYKVSIPGFLKAIRQANGFHGACDRAENGLYPLGARDFPGVGDCRVYFYSDAGRPSAAEHRLLAAAAPASASIVVFPLDPGIDHSGRLGAAGVYAAWLGESFTIHWPVGVQLPKGADSAISQRLVDTVEAGFKQIGVNVSELKAENEILKTTLAEKMTCIAGEVEPEFFNWIMHVLAAGSVSGAARMLGIPSSSFSERFNAYRKRGGLYETLYQLYRVRRAKMGTLTLERYNDTFEKHQPCDAESDAGLLKEVFDALKEQNGSNWEDIRDEMMEVLQDAIP